MHGEGNISQNPVASTPIFSFRISSLHVTLVSVQGSELLMRYIRRYASDSKSS
jgi:hypothetical protein